MCRLGIAVADTEAVQELDVEELGAQPPLITQGIDSGDGAGEDQDVSIDCPSIFLLRG